MKRFTVILTLISAALCVIHYLGYDPRNYLLFSFSVPLWFLPIFTDIRLIPLTVAYLLTIASWTAIGYFIDILLERRRAR